MPSEVDLLGKSQGVIDRHAGEICEFHMCVSCAALREGGTAVVSEAL